MRARWVNGVHRVLRMPCIVPMVVNVRYHDSDEPVLLGRIALVVVLEHVHLDQHVVLAFRNQRGVNGEQRVWIHRSHQ